MISHQRHVVFFTKVANARLAKRSGRLGSLELTHDDVIKWRHFPRYWPCVRGIHRSTVNSSHKGQWRGTLMFTLICTRIIGWVNNREAGDLRRNRAHYDVIVMFLRRRGQWCLNSLIHLTTKSIQALHNYPFVMGIDQRPVDSHQKGTVIVTYVTSLRHLVT